MERSRKILFLVSEDWYFCSHRLPIARAAKEAGFEVIVVTRVERHGNKIRNEGFRLIPLNISRRSKNPLNELKTIIEIIKIYRSENPDIVHHVALKPVIYGALAAWLTGVPAFVNALAGLGYVFSSVEMRARILRYPVKIAFRYLLNKENSIVLLQNPDDRDLLLRSNTIASNNTALIKGSGVDTQRFNFLPEPDELTITVTLVSRMIRDKGIFEFVEATRQLKEKGIDFRAVLVGMPDPENPTSISTKQLEAWHAEKLVEWWGQIDDIPGVWAKSHIAVLPSFYGEGVPMSLIEAASCGRPIITTDIPGCREIVKNEKNGLLVPIKDTVLLADAILKLVEDADLRRQMGKEGRRLVEAEFSESIVIRQTMEIYRSVLDDKWPVVS